MQALFSEGLIRTLDRETKPAVIKFTDPAGHWESRAMLQCVLTFSDRKVKELLCLKARTNREEQNWHLTKLTFGTNLRGRLTSQSQFVSLIQHSRFCFMSAEIIDMKPRISLCWILNKVHSNAVKDPMPSSCLGYKDKSDKGVGCCSGTLCM